jgi:septum formation protein
MAKTRGRAAAKQNLILASQSPARQRLLKRLGADFQICPAYLDEDKIAAQIREPRRLVRELSKLKAQAVLVKFPGSVVIGSDQVLIAPGGRIFGKPLTSARARGQLKACSGKVIELLTGVCVSSKAHGDKVFVHRTRMKFRKLSKQEIADYVKADLPLECSGSFKFESFGISLFDTIKTDDPTAIEGLPLLKLAQILRDQGLRFRL